MNSAISRLRILLLVVLLAIEILLVVSLRRSGWLETGDNIRQVFYGIAVALPFIMAAVLFYRMRMDLSRGQISLRSLLALMLVVASFLTLLKLLEKPAGPNLGPLPLASTVKFEIYSETATETTEELSFTYLNDDSLVINPPIITSGDVATIELLPATGNEVHASLAIVLNVNGGTKLQKATSTGANRRLVVVVDGVVLASPRIVSPISHQFRLSGGRIASEGYEVFRELTGTADAR